MTIPPLEEGSQGPPQGRFPQGPQPTGPPSQPQRGAWRPPSGPPQQPLPQQGQWQPPSGPPQPPWPQQGDQQPPGTPQPPAKKPLYKRPWFIALVIAFIVIGIVASQNKEEPTNTAAVPSSSPSATGTPTTDSAAPTTEPAPPPPPPPVGFGDGTHRIGTDVPAGTYRSEEASLCYWARLSGFSGELGDIIANGNTGLEIVTLALTDVGFETQGCGDWVAVEATFPPAPVNSFGDGTFQIGAHIPPGTYRSDGDPSDLCYWARLADFSHELDGIITNGNSPTVIEITPADVGFTSSGCGQWTL